MSITVKLFTTDELERIKNPKTKEDKRLATIYLNKKTFSGMELDYRPNSKYKNYIVWFEFEEDNDIFSNCTELKAVDDDSLRWFLKKEYDYKCIVDIVEEVTTWRRVKL